MKMKKKIFVIIAACLLLAGAASANIVTLRLNYFVPRLTSDISNTDDFWHTEFENMSFNKSNFQDVSFGIQYEAFLNRDFSFVLGLDIYKKNKGGYYRDWVGYSFDGGDYAFPYPDFNGDFELSHAVTLTAAPLQASLKWAPLGRRGNIIPYIGGGVHAMFWNVKMQGDMIDFNDPYVYTDEYGDVSVYPVYSVNARESDGLGRVSFGWQAFGGLMIPMGNRATIDVGGQYFSCPAEFTNAFKDFRPIDLGGFQLSVGINYWF
jgi:opacity protein-like surface antigen